MATLGREIFERARSSKCRLAPKSRRYASDQLCATERHRQLGVISESKQGRIQGHGSRRIEVVRGNRRATIIQVLETSVTEQAGALTDLSIASRLLVETSGFIGVA